MSAGNSGSAVANQVNEVNAVNPGSGVTTQVAEVNAVSPGPEAAATFLNAQG